MVFNFPAGDTVCSLMQNPDYYTLKHYYGEAFIRQRKDVFGDIETRPVDRRENYVKRCVGTPGDSLQIIDNIIYVNGEREPEREGLQLNYYVQTDGHIFSAKYLEKIGISVADRVHVDATTWHFPLTEAMREELSKNPHVLAMIAEPEDRGGAVYPMGHNEWIETQGPCTRINLLRIRKSGEKETDSVIPGTGREAALSVSGRVCVHYCKK